MKALLLLSPFYCLLATYCIVDSHADGMTSASSTCGIEKRIIDEFDSVGISPEQKAVDILGISELKEFENAPQALFFVESHNRDQSELILIASKRGPPFLV